MTSDSNNNGSASISLSLPTDEDWLSRPLCIIRRQIEVFAATEDDVADRPRQPIKVGYVGLRCRHCARLSFKERTKASTSYPNRISLIHQAVRNFQRFHFFQCSEIPDEIKEELKSHGRKGNSRKFSENYWVESCKEQLNMEDAQGSKDGERYIRFRTATTSNSGTDAGKDADKSLGNGTAGGSSPEPEIDILALDINEDDVFRLLNDDYLELGVDVEAKAPDEALQRRQSDGFGNCSTQRTVAADAASASSVSEYTERRKELLVNLETVYHLVHGMKKTASADPVDNDMETAETLEQLGNAVYRTFTGKDAPRNWYDRDVGSDDFSTVDEAAETFANADLETKGRKKPARENKTLARADDLSTHPALRDSDLPVQLIILIAGMLSSQNVECVERYRSLEQVEDDLRRMMDNPDRHLFDIPARKQTGRLDFRQLGLHGRESEQAELSAVFNSVLTQGGPREAVLVQGSSGTGKTSLVEQHMNDLLFPCGGRVIYGKFMELGEVQPIAVLFKALDKYCLDNIPTATDSASTSDICRSIFDALGVDGCAKLCSVMPNLGAMLSISPNAGNHEVDGQASMNRLIYNLRLFIKAISGPTRPLAFVLDDIHWADAATLDLVATLLSDQTITSLLFIGCYRNDNVAGPTHPLNEFRSRLTQCNIGVRGIVLTDMDKNEVNETISDLLHLPSRVTGDIANSAFSKTGGNPLFLKQFLISLYDDDLLFYSAANRRWEWDQDGIRTKQTADNTVGLLISKMRRLDNRVQNLLKTAAALGSQFKKAILYLAIGLDDGTGSRIMEIETLLQIIVNEGFMHRTGTGDSTCDSYVFAHDQIREAAYDLIPSNDRPLMHLQIGRSLRRSTTDLEDISGVIVDQLMRGSMLITDPNETIDVAELFLLAGKKAASSSSFVPAALYFLQGATLLKEENWTDNYELSLSLFTGCVEAQYVLGNHEGVSIALWPILLHGRCVMDKFPACLANVNSLGGKGMHTEAVAFGLKILNELGESFPNDPQTSDVVQEYVKTTLLLQGKTMKHWFMALGTLDSTDWASCASKAISEAPPMDNPEKEATILLSLAVGRYASFTKGELAVLCVLRAVKLTLTYGPCRHSAAAFASFGVLYSSREDFEQAHRFGKLSLLLLERFDQGENVARVYAFAYAGIFSVTEPLQSVIAQLRHGYEVGMSCGKLEMAFSCARLVALRHLGCGTKLSIASKEAMKYVSEMKQTKYHLLYLALPTLQTMLNLMGDSDDPTILTGSAMNEEDFMKEIMTGNFAAPSIANIVLAFDFLRLWLSYLFGQYDRACEIAAEVIERTKGEHQLRIQCASDEAFHMGLVAVLMASKELPQNSTICWRGIMDTSIKKLTVKERCSAWNFQHRVALLNAERSYYVRQDIDEAAKYYEEAIKASSEHKFVHENALAYERASIFYMQIGQASSAANYFSKAQGKYREWGANAKADAMQRK